MRISDWSSDVCSSDLIRLGNLKVEPLRVLLRLGRLFGLLLLKLERLELAVCLHLLGGGLRLLQLSFGKLLVSLGNRGRLLAVALTDHRAGNIRRIFNKLPHTALMVAGNFQRSQ